MVLDGLRYAYNLNRRAVAALEPDVFAHGIGARPIVFRELLIHDGDTRVIRGIGGQEAAATQNRNPHRLEVSFIHRIHSRTKILAIARHLKTIRHEGDAVKAFCSERNILGESLAVNSRRLPYAFGQQLIELLGLSCVVLHQTRIEAGHQEMVFGEAGSLKQGMLETPDHQESRGQQHQGQRDLRHYQHIPAPQAFASGHVNVGGLESVHQVRARALQRRRQAAKKRAQSGQHESR